MSRPEEIKKIDKIIRRLRETQLLFTRLPMALSLPGADGLEFLLRSMYDLRKQMLAAPRNRCMVLVHTGGEWGLSVPCNDPGEVEVDGVTYCKQHDPR